MSAKDIGETQSFQHTGCVQLFVLLTCAQDLDNPQISMPEVGPVGNADKDLT